MALDWGSVWFDLVWFEARANGRERGLKPKLNQPFAVASPLISARPPPPPLTVGRIN